MRAPRSPLGWRWAGLGLVGSCAIAVAATDLLRHRPIHWWWRLPLPGGHGTAWHVFWIGVAVLCAAWLGLGWRLWRTPAARPVDLIRIGAVWLVPVMLGPALFSLDLYSYLAQGTLLHHGINPYHTGPVALAGLHDQRLLETISPIWRHTTAPYGPAFIALAGGVAAVSGTHLLLGVMLMRALELIGFILLAVFTPRLARLLGADPARATWLAVIGPLTLLPLLGGGHNDALMAGLLVAGVTVALERRPLLGIAICALAAAVKLPAAAAVVLIAISWIRAEPERAGTIVAKSAGVVLAVLVAAGAIAGVGFSWISGSLFSTPESVRLAITPATATAVTLAKLLHSLGFAASTKSLESVATVVAVALVGCAGIWACLRVRLENLVGVLGLVLLAAAIGGPAAWPWYLSWALPLLAAHPTAQRSGWWPVLIVAPVFPVMAGGQVAFGIDAAPHVLLIYLLGATLAVSRIWRPALRPAVRAPGLARS